LAAGAKLHTSSAVAIASFMSISLLNCACTTLLAAAGGTASASKRFALNWRLQLLTLLAELNKEM
jgi:hypothetical protein